MVDRMKMCKEVKKKIKKRIEIIEIRNKNIGEILINYIKKMKL